MMSGPLLNRDLFTRDPTQFSIPNLGVAKVQEPETPSDWETLAYELESFVCEGEYERGLDRVLGTFLQHVNEPQQPAVWVSGFYGSGKSHFARVLEFIWRDVAFPNGERARNRVNLPEEIRAKLVELSNQGKRRGGLWSAAGMLNAAAGHDVVRLGMLGIIFRSAGLPSQYGRATFVLYLKEQEIYDEVKGLIEARGKNFTHETENYLVSPVVREALLEANPDFATSPRAVGELLKAQFPPASDVSDDDLVEAIDRVLALKAKENGKEGERPLTLIIFDELQQFIGEDPARTLQVQGVVQAITSRFGSSVLFLGTGQAALGSTAQLQKLQGRFTVRVTLDNADVERVVREVVLRKKPEHRHALRQALDRSSGEIARQLSGTRIAMTPEREVELVPDYPLLPSRREFWEAILRAVDSGSAGQLRTQLRIVHETTKGVAHREVGHVIPGDAIYDQLRNDMLQSGVLLPEMSKAISDLDDQTSDGRLKSRLAGLAFLIDRLPTEGPAATGLRATADFLADLLVEDLNEGGAPLRAKVPGLLDDLAERGVMMKDGDEYQLQTREGTRWEGIFRDWQARISDDNPRLSDERTKLLRARVSKELDKLIVLHGASKEPRAIEIHWGMDVPTSSTGKIPVWIRDEWSVAEKSVKEDARQLGTSSPVVSVFLPQRESEAIRRTIARYLAAEETLNAKGNPTTTQGQQARGAMVSRRDAEGARLTALIDNVVLGARVFKGGGDDISEASLKDAVLRGAEDGKERLYPKFKPADHSGWDKVVARAAKDSDALGNVGYKGDPADHEVAKAIRAHVGAGGKKGSDVRDAFSRPPYGWPKDAIDGTLILLVATGQLRATKNGQALLATELTRQAMGAVDFAGEDVVISKPEMITIRGLLQELGSPVASDDEARGAIRPVLNALIDLARQAGGDPPLPAPPSVEMLRDILVVSGNAQLRALLDHKDEIHGEVKTWKSHGQKATVRLPKWELLQRMLRHGLELDAIEEIRQQAEAVREQRALLEDPDPAAPLLTRSAEALREALKRAHAGLAATRKRELDALAATAEWKQLSDEKWSKILAANGLGTLPHLETGTDDQLVRLLDREPLADWDERVIAVPQRIAMAREDAAKYLYKAPQKVRPRNATLKTKAEVDAYLQELGSEIMQHIEAGNPVII